MSPPSSAYRPTGFEPAAQVNTAAQPTTPGARAPTDRGPMQLGHAVGPYTLWERIGRGGLGDVYRAFHAETGEEVALKLLRAGEDAGPAELRSFDREIEAARKLAHPNILPILDSGVHDGQPFFTMPLVAGGSLTKRLAHLDLRAGVSLLAKVARAVHSAHLKGVVHRDLKPGNILLGPNDEPLVADFGLARFLDQVTMQTMTGKVMGSLPYMSPEQAAGQAHKSSPATDVWALGVMLYELIAGVRPFDGESTLDVLHHIQHHEPVPLRRVRADVPRDLEAVCGRCLRKSQRERYQSAGELAVELERWLAGEAISEPPQRRSGGLALAGACWAALVFVLFALADPGPRKEPPAFGSRAWLDTAEARVKPGVPLALIDEGKVGWNRLMTTPDGASPVRIRPDRSIAVTLHGVHYLEFLPPRAGRRPFRMTMTLRQNDLTKGTRVGLYSARRDHPVGDRAVHTAAEVVFNEADGNDKVGPPVKIDFRSLEMLGEAPLSNAVEQTLARGRLPADRFRLGKGPWRTISMEVTDVGIRLVAPGPVVATGWKEAQSEMAWIRQRKRPNWKGLPIDFSPAGGAGVFVLNSSVEIQKLTVEFLDR